jgi:hypothetical protein
MKLGAVLVLCVLCQACSCPGGRRGPTEGARDAGGGRDAIVDPDAPDRPIDGSTSPVDCSDEARWIYLVDSANKFLRFEPDTNMLTEVGTLACPGGSTPFSMGVDRNATAWVLHQDHRIYHVDVTTVACNATSYAPDQMGLELFGMGFVSDASGSDDETLFIGGGPEAGIGGGSSTLAFVDEVTLAVGTIGPMTGSPELTGNGAGELWGFFPDATPMAVRQIDKGSGTTVRGLIINRFSGHGIVINSGIGGQGNVIEGNWIGLDSADTADAGNTLDGINIQGSDNNEIGGVTAAQRNVISDNSDGIQVLSGSTGNQIRGNFIGLNAAGTATVGNTGSGVHVLAVTGNTIGGTTSGAGNILSGNGFGIVLDSTSNNVVLGNLIGTDPTGTADLGNTLYGITIQRSPNNTIGGAAAGARNIISGNNATGVFIQNAGTASSGNIIQGNYIGTDITGVVAIANSGGGVVVSGADGTIIGGAAPGEANLIAGNSVVGVRVSGATADGSQIKGNLIGVNVNGAALGNGPRGIHLLSGADNTTIGGTTAGARNVIAAATQNGIEIADVSGTVVQGNYIGLDPTGTLALANGSDGIHLRAGATNTTIGGTAPGARNVISGNGNDGIEISGSGGDFTSTGNFVQGNFIGTDVVGTGAIGNEDGGIAVSTGASNNQIGGAAAGAGNTIAFNDIGVTVDGETTIENRVQGNAIFSNTGLGIDLGDDGVTPNDPGDGDGSPNHLQNFPVLTGAVGTSVSGTLNSTPNTTFTLDFYSSFAADASGHGEGQFYLGSTPVTTDGSGNIGFNATLTGAVSPGQVVTATATDPTNNTSEFSPALAVGLLPLTIRTNGTGIGNVTSEPAGINFTGGQLTASFPQNQIVTLTATADPGSSFLGWTGLGIDSTEATLDVTVSQARTITATFVPATASLVLPDASAPLNPGNETDLYRFNAVAGDRLDFVINATPTTGSNAIWRLFDPNNLLVFSNNFSGASFPVTIPNVTLPHTGAYTLAIEGIPGNTQTGTYTFNIFKVGHTDPIPPTGTAYTVGATVPDSVTNTAPDPYVFTLTQDAQIVFDALSNSPNVSWTLAGPPGTVIGTNGTVGPARSMTGSDSFGIAATNPVLTLPAGTYVLTFTTTQTAAQNYAFRLLDLAAATPLTLGVSTVGADLAVPSETDLYRFTANAGDEVYVDVVTASDTGNTYMRLISPVGTQVFQRNQFSDQDTVTLPLTGTYTLLLEGWHANTGTDTYTINVRPVTDETFTITPAQLAAGAIMSDALDEIGEQDRYRFTLAGTTQLYFDALTPSHVLGWTLAGPRGTEVGSNGLSINAAILFFSSSDGPSSSVMVLPAGDYTLTVDATGANQDAIGSYAFRLLDLSTAPPLTSGTPVGPGAPLTLAGTLFPPGDGAGTPTTFATPTHVYQFAATAGEKVYIDIVTASDGNGSTWRLVDPLGRSVATNTLSNDLDVTPLSLAGVYTFLVEPAISNTGTDTYSINVQKVTDDTAALTLNSPTNGNIQHVGQQDRYTFTLDPSANPYQLYFDVLTNTAAPSLNWTLTGPQGMLIGPSGSIQNSATGRSFVSSDAGGIGTTPALSLPSGAYQLTVDATFDFTGSYDFRLLDLAVGSPAVQALTPGTPVSSTLLANETDVYQFAATAGMKIYLDVQAASDPNGAISRLVGPAGQQIFVSGGLSDLDVTTLAAAGTYRLLVEGGRTNTGTDSYTINVVPVVDGTPTTITATQMLSGDTLLGAIALPGEQDTYTFTLADTTQLYFDALTNNGSLAWSLVGPSGAGAPIVSNRGFTVSDGSNLSTVNPVLSLPAGVYTLVVDGHLSATGGYAFRLLDLAGATEVTATLGTPFGGSLSQVVNAVTVASETDLYQFTTTQPNQRFYFDGQAQTNMTTAQWRLVDPHGVTLFRASGGGSGLQDVETLTLAEAGTYRLLIEGHVSVTGASSYTINVQPVVDEVGEPFPISLTATPDPLDLEVNQTINGNIDVTGDQDRYTFTVGAGGARLYFDALSGTGMQWNLVGPAGAGVPVVGNTSFNSSESVAFLALPTGDYTLTVDGQNQSTGAYSFRLMDLAVAAPLAYDTSVTVNLTPLSETDLYQFAATAGDQVFFDVQSSTGGTNTFWRLIDPTNTVLFNQVPKDGTGALFDVGPLVLAQSGVYTLLVEGGYSTGAPLNLTFFFDHQGTPGATPLSGIPYTPGDLINDSVTSAAPDNFLFTLNQDSRLYFDALTNSGLVQWSLFGPSGPNAALVSNRAFNASDGGLNFNPVLDLPGGTYQVRIGTSQSTAQSYSFRLWDLAAATPLTPGTPISGALTSSREADLYRFTTNQANERFYFDVQTLSGSPSAWWRLIDPLNNELIDANVSGVSSDVDTLTLPLVGTYTLIFEGLIGNTVASNYTLNVQPVVDEVGDPFALTLNQAVTGAIDVAGEQDQYQFSLGAGGARLYFDSLTNNQNIRWSLVGPAGPDFPLVQNRTFTLSDAGDLSALNINPVLALPEGAYTLTIDGNGAATGAYAFRLLDLASAQAIIPGTSFSGLIGDAPGTELSSMRVTPSPLPFAGSGQALAFNDTSSHARVPDALGLRPAQLTVEAWVKPDASIGGTDVVLAKSTTSAVSDGYSLSMASATQIRFIVNGTNGSSITQGIATATLPSGTWSHVAGTYDGIAAKIYINGVLASSTAFALPLVHSTKALTIGGGFDSSFSQWNGNIDEVRVWNLARTQVEIQAARSQTLVGNEPGLAAYWRFDEASGATVLDQTANANHGGLGQPRETDLYRFTTTQANERVYFDLQEQSGGTAGASRAWWQLVDPFNAVLFKKSFADATPSASSSSDVEPLTLAFPGTYTLLVEGDIVDTRTAGYRFTAQPIVDEAGDPFALTLNQTTAGAIDVAGESDRYTFAIDSGGARVAFDALAGTAGVRWSLAGPTGDVVTNRLFTASDANTLTTGAVFSLVEGAYTLTVDGVGDAAVPYSFRLVDVATVTDLTPTLGTAVANVTLTPGNETDFYRFTAAAGDKFFFDVTQLTLGGNSLQWRLVDPLNANVFRTVISSTATDVDTLTLTNPGVYTLMVEGYFDNTSTVTYGFNVQPAADEIIPLTLGATINEAIDVKGERDVYTFTLLTATRVSFDSFTDSTSLPWTLTGAQGTVVNARQFAASDSVDLGSSGTPTAVMALPAGSYTITVDTAGEATPSYSFRLLDAATAVDLTPTLGTPRSDTLSPANETDLYQFTTTAPNQTFYFDLVSKSGAPGAYWRLVDPFNNVVPIPAGTPTQTTGGNFLIAFNTPSGSTGGTSDVGPLTLPNAGIYTLAIEGRRTDTAGTGDYTINVIPVTDETAPLVFGLTYSDAIDEIGERDHYTFTLGEAGRFYFDSLSNIATAVWSLVGPAGTVVNARAFNASFDGVNTTNPILSLPAGAYELIVDGTAENMPAYAFRLLDLAASPELTQTIPVVEFPQAESLWPGTLTFTWQGIEPPAGQVLMGYNVYVGTAPGQYGTPVFVPPDQESLTITGVPPVQHYFVVTALTLPRQAVPAPLSALSTQHSALSTSSDAPLFPEAAPTAQPDLYATARNLQFSTVKATGVLRNDSDSDGNPLTASLLTGADPAKGVVVAFNPDGSFIYKPNPTYTGSVPDSFTYLVSDGNGGTAAGLVSIFISQESGFSVESTATPQSGLQGWTIRDEGTAGGSSDWNAAQSPIIAQLNPIGPGGAAGEQNLVLGTHLFLTDGLPEQRTDAHLTYTLRAGTSETDATRGALGIMFRYVDEDNYYRFSMERDPNGDGNLDDGYRRLVKVENGVPTMLNEQVGLAAMLGEAAYIPGHVYDFDLNLQGTTMTLRVSGADEGLMVAWSRSDVTLISSGLALYSARNAGSYFDLIGTALGDPAPNLVGLEVRATGTGLGTISGSTGSGISLPGSPASFVPVGTPVTLMAQPAPGLGFGGWKLNGTTISTSPVLAQTITGATVLEAVFTGTPLPAVNLDLFGDGGATSAADGKILMRYLAGTPDSQLLGGLTPSPTVPRDTPQEIRSYLNTAKNTNTLLDADGNGQLSPFADGRLVFRFLQERESGQQNDATLLAGNVIGAGATRTSASAIRSYLNTYFPPAAPTSADASLVTEPVAPSTASEASRPVPLASNLSDGVVPLDFSGSFSVQTTTLGDTSDDQMLSTPSRPWLQDFVVSSAVLTDDPNRDLAVVL